MTFFLNLLSWRWACWPEEEYDEIPKPLQKLISQAVIQLGGWNKRWAYICNIYWGYEKITFMEE